MTEILQELEQEIVGVRIHADNRKSSKRYLRSTIKCYAIDNVTVPTVQLAPFNPNRASAVITTNDVACVVTQDNPPPTTVASAAANAPPGNSAHISPMGNGFEGIEIFGPDPIWAISITGNTQTRVNVIQHIWCYDE